MKARKIAVVGPESTGKSELCQQLARYYQTEWVPEYARFYLDRLDRPYEPQDLLEMAQGQLAWEDQKIEGADRYLFCDTNLLVFKVWSDHKYGGTDPWIQNQMEERQYDYYLLANIDLPWRPDPQREHPKLRQYFLEVYTEHLKEMKVPFGKVSGVEDVRTQNAIQLIEDFFNT